MKVKCTKCGYVEETIASSGGVVDKQSVYGYCPICHSEGYLIEYKENE